MKLRTSAFLLLAALLPGITPAQTKPERTVSYLGFDRNTYPGETSLPALRKTFSFTGYWLNNPPGETTNSWAGKRKRIQDAGFGFLVLFNGRTYAQIRTGDPAQAGKADGQAAARAATREGFPNGTIIFLDQEEGGRLLPEQRAYLHAWVDTVTAAGFRPGVYCSGVPFQEGAGTVVITAEDIRSNAGARRISFWVSNDACPPSPGCVTAHAPSPAVSGISFADVWQYAQSPRRKEMTANCSNTYDKSGECYAPGIAREKQLHLDLNSATSPDPSHARRR